MMAKTKVKIRAVGTTAPKHNYLKTWADTADYVRRFDECNQLKGGNKYRLNGKEVVV